MAEMLQAESSMPLYVQLMDRIRQEIRRGVYPVGVQIPPEHELVEKYGVSRVTVRRALQDLTGEGLLERKQGKGTFVAQQKPEIRERRFQGFHDACREAGRTPSVSGVRVRESVPTEEERQKLNLAPDARILEIRRVLEADGVPVILEENHFSMAYAWLESANVNGSLYRALQDYGIQVEKCIYDLSMRPVNAEEAELLRIEQGTAVLVSDQLVFDQKGRPLHTSHQLIRGDKYTLRI